MRAGMRQVKARRIRKPHIIDSRPLGQLSLALLLVALALGGWGYLTLEISRAKQSLSHPVWPTLKQLGLGQLGHDQSDPEPSAPAASVVNPSATSVSDTEPPEADAPDEVWSVATLLGVNPPKAADFEQLEQRRAELKDEIAVLEERLQRLTTDRQTETKGVQHAQDQIRQLQTENATLRSQIAFLNQLFGGDDGPIEISDLALAREGNERMRYWFKVSRTDPNGEMFRGIVKIQLRGQMQGEERYFDLSELTDNALEGHRLGFRYFQEIDGTLSLPPGLEPEELLVVVIPDDQAIGGARRQFEWRIDQDPE